LATSELQVGLIPRKMKKRTKNRNVLTFFKQKLSRLLRIAICSLLFYFCLKDVMVGILASLPLFIIIVLDAVELFEKQKDDEEK
jgi:hypothetical protein